MSPYEELSIEKIDKENCILKIKEEFKNRQSIIVIISTYKNITFFFDNITYSATEKELKNLNFPYQESKKIVRS